MEQAVKQHFKTMSSNLNLLCGDVLLMERLTLEAAEKARLPHVAVPPDDYFHC